LIAVYQDQTNLASIILFYALVGASRIVTVSVVATDCPTIDSVWRKHKIGIHCRLLVRIKINLVKLHSLTLSGVLCKFLLMANLALKSYDFERHVK